MNNNSKIPGEINPGEIVQSHVTGLASLCARFAHQKKFESIQAFAAGARGESIPTGFVLAASGPIVPALVKHVQAFLESPEAKGLRKRAIAAGGQVADSRDSNN